MMTKVGSDLNLTLCTVKAICEVCFNTINC